MFLNEVIVFDDTGGTRHEDLDDISPYRKMKKEAAIFVSHSLNRESSKYATVDKPWCTAFLSWQEHGGSGELKEEEQKRGEKALQ